MIKFPETALNEWNIVAAAARAETEVREKIRRATSVEHEVERLRVRHEAQALFQAELDAGSTPTLEMMTLASYRANPTQAPRDLIEGVMKDGGVCAMLGPSGSGKSTLALQMLYSLSTGTDFLAQPVVQISGAVGVVSYDMDGSMLMDWVDGYPNFDEDSISVVNAHKRGNPLGVPSMRAAIAQTWKAMGVEVVMIDSFSASFFGQDENDAAATQAHYRDLKMFALTEVGARALIVIVHSTTANPHKARGSSVHTDVADTIVSLSVDDKTGSRLVDMPKYRAARGQAQMKPVMITAPDQSTHLVDIDPGAMTLAGLGLPARSAAMFDPIPDAHETPDTTEEDDDL